MSNPGNPAEIDSGGWRTCVLGDVINVTINERWEARDIPDDGWTLDLEDIERDTGRLLNRRTLSDRPTSGARVRFEAGDVLYSKLRPALNKVLMADQAGFATTELVVLRPPQGLDARYLAHWLRSPAFHRYATSAVHGISMPRLGMKALRLGPFLLPSNDVQRQLADRLDAIDSRYLALRNLLRQTREEVSAAQTHTVDQLTGGTSNELPDATTTLQDLLADAGPTYGVVKLGGEVPGGVACLRTSNLRWLDFDLGTVKEIDPEISERHSRTVLKGREVLISIRGTLGGVAAAQESMSGWNVSREIAVLRPDAETVNPKYLAYRLAARDVQSWLETKVRGVAYSGINIADLRLLPLAVPPRPEQEAIADRIEDRLRSLRRLETELGRSERLLDTAVSAARDHILRPPVSSDTSSADETFAQIQEGLAAQRAQPRPQRRRSPSMRPTTADQLMNIARSMPEEQFRADELRNRSDLAYDDFQELLFELLGRAGTELQQVFDTESGTVLLTRTAAP